MPEENEKELIEHKLVLDEFLELSIKIPRVLTATDFKALTTKANKLFRLADVPIVEDRKPRQYTSRRNIMPDGIVRFILKRRVVDDVMPRQIHKEIEEKFGKKVNDKYVSQTVYNIRTNQPGRYKKLIAEIKAEVE